jgi:hypothetical protein
MKKLNLNENFISRIWGGKMYYEGLKTTDGKPVEVLDYGVMNKDSGADYINARIKIENSVFSGDIEIHRSLKDWHLHNHKRNGKYNKVILQVVLWNDDFPSDTGLPVAMKSREIPTVILSEFLTKSIHEIWKDIINNPSKEFKLPCFPENGKLDPEQKKEWIKKVSLKRLNYRAGRLNLRLEILDKIYGGISKKHCWEKLFFEYTLEALGFSKNKEQFLKFAEYIEPDRIKKSGLGKIETESMFFGVAGLLSDLKYKDAYIEKLKTNWENIKEKFKPPVMNKAEWNFFRLRPQNFPTIRMAYAVSLCREILFGNFFKRVVLCFEKSKSTKADLTELFLGLELSEYWKSHYVFGKKVSTNIKSIGEDRVQEIITNVVLPLLHLYSDVFKKDILKRKVKDYYFSAKDKSINEITKIMQVQLGVKTSAISENQGLIHLHNFYCVKGKCDECLIGNEVFGKGDKPDVLRIILY